ncbi:MAG TPA: type 2 isopentenyl-diphosphate Delta-isomerase [Chloroflexi bacterium]|nr:MAG: type 2 isopentenyl-diphosphate Delta-isomerase [Chloroflexota bacterium]HDD54637.1 type 2 isopentenyl-diphosphate Delta-isomerase [Chloroflexota bacterium]
MAKKISSTSSRKSDHIRINLTEEVRSGISTGLEDYSFPHQALPELDLGEIRLDLRLFGKKITAPVFISSMTGGTNKAGKINQILAEAAQAAGIPMGVGSQRAALEEASLAESFKVRKAAPDILLFANLGAVQLNYGVTAVDCQRVVEMIEADALILHLNPLQEAVMAEGNTNFAGLIAKIEEVCKTLSVPVIAKEVGWGISRNAAIMLRDAGISAIDVAGAGGTSWTEVEIHRSETAIQRQVASSFGDWGIPTAESIQIVHQAAPDIPIFASGGIRNGVEIAKTIALGATLAGLAGPFLKAADESPQAVLQVIDRLTREIQISMFASGAKDLRSLGKIHLLKG